MPNILKMPALASCFQLPLNIQCISDANTNILLLTHSHTHENHWDSVVLILCRPLRSQLLNPLITDVIKLMPLPQQPPSPNHILRWTYSQMIWKRSHSVCQRITFWTLKSTGLNGTRVKAEIKALVVRTLPSPPSSSSSHEFSLLTLPTTEWYFSHTCFTWNSRDDWNHIVYRTYPL